MLAHEMTKLERHAVGVGELQVGDAVGGLGGASGCLCVSCAVELGKPREGGAAAHCNVLRRMIALEELRLVILVKRDKRCDAACDPGMTGQRPMLCLGKN